MSLRNISGSDNPGADSPAERRRNLRFPFTATVEAIVGESGVSVFGRASDLGLGGCYIDTLNPLPVGTEVKLRISKENETFEVQAKVVSSKMGMGMGIAFVSAQPSQIHIFQKWILDISRQSAPLSETGPAGAPPAEQIHLFHSGVLGELVLTLMKKNVLTESEGKELLRKLYE